MKPAVWLSIIVKCGFEHGDSVNLTHFLPLLSAKHADKLVYYLIRSSQMNYSA